MKIYFQMVHKLGILLVVLLWGFSSFSQDTDDNSKSATLTITGTMYEDGVKLSGVEITVKQDGQVIKEQTSDGNGKFELTFELDEIFLISFYKDDYAEKFVEIDTRNVPENDRKFNFYVKGWKVDMIPNSLDVDVSILKEPVGILVYNPAEEQFSIDKKYERKMRAGLQKLADDVYEAYQQLDMDSEAALDDYMLAIKDGDLFLKEGDYEQAMFQYEAAKELLPNETYPDKQMKKVLALMNANKDVDELYASHLTTADEAFEEKDWETARNFYTKAHDVKPKQDYPKDQIDLIIKNIAEEKALAIKMAEEERQKKYNAQIAQADSLFALGSYGNAKKSYVKANEIQKGAAYPKTKIKEIDDLLAAQSKTEAAFTSLLANANKFFNQKNYTEAHKAYTQALGIKPEAEEPQQKIKEIETLMASLQALKAKEAELAKRKELELNEKYQTTITRADALFVDKSYEDAKATYEEALALKSNEEYPKNQIVLINKELLKLEGMEKQFENLLASADKSFAAGAYENARNEYVAALEIKPGAEKPTAKIAEIDAKLAAIAQAEMEKNKALEKEFNDLIAAADAKYATKDLNGAEQTYLEALKLKPSADYPKSQLSKINDERAAIKLAEEMAAKEAAQLAEKQKAYDAAIVKADNYFKQNDLEKAKLAYQEAQSINEENIYPVSQITLIDDQLAQLAAEKLAKEQQEAAKLAIRKKYEDAVKKADNALALKDYPTAKLAYQNALSILPEEAYPSNQLTKIEEQIAAEKAAEAERLLALEKEAERKAKFDKLVEEGDQLEQAKSYELAKYKYEAALKIYPGDPNVTQKMRNVSVKYEAARKLAEFHAQNDTEFNRQLAVDYPNGLNETKKEGGKTVQRIVIVGNGRGDEYRKETYSYGAVFFFKNGKKIDESTFKRETGIK